MKKQSISAKWKKGAQCTVSAHYGHWDEGKIMKITGFMYDQKYQSKIKVFVDGLKWGVDKGLVKLIES